MNRILFITFCVIPLWVSANHLVVKNSSQTYQAVISFMYDGEERQVTLNKGDTIVLASDVGKVSNMQFYMADSNYIGGMMKWLNTHWRPITLKDCGAGQAVYVNITLGPKNTHTANITCSSAQNIENLSQGDIANTQMYYNAYDFLQEALPYGVDQLYNEEVSAITLYIAGLTKAMPTITQEIAYRLLGLSNPTIETIKETWSQWVGYAPTQTTQKQLQQHLLDTYKPEPIEDKLKKELQKIVEDADKRHS